METGTLTVKLKSLDEHNEERRRAYAEMWAALRRPRANGIACPRCGRELRDSDPSSQLATSPPQYATHCAAEGCNYSGCRTA